MAITGLSGFSEMPISGKAGHVVKIEIVDDPNINTGLRVICGPAEEVDPVVI